MPFTEDICVVVTCDGCGDGWTTDQYAYTPHFPDYDAARADLIDHGWHIDGARLVCPDCTRLEACARAGHDWGPWRVAASLPTPSGPWSGRVRSCRACPDSEWDPALVAVREPVGERA
jgi:hypothetical protein